MAASRKTSDTTTPEDVQTVATTTAVDASGELPSDARAVDSAAAATQDAVTEQLRTEWEQGYRGVSVDPTPNENYTLAGVCDPSKVVPEERKIQAGQAVYPEVHEDVTDSGSTAGNEG